MAHEYASPDEMQAKYEQLFEPMTSEQLLKVYRGLVANGDLKPAADAVVDSLTADELAELCKGVDHVYVALSVASEDDPELHRLIMRMQIARGPRGTADPQASRHRRPNGSWSTASRSASGGGASAAAAPRAPRGPAPPDNRVLSRVAPNPKKVGSKAHSVYECYREGITVREFVDAVKATGKTEADAMANLKYDMSKGFVEVSDAAQS